MEVFDLISYGMLRKPKRSVWAVLLSLVVIVLVIVKIEPPKAGDFVDKMPFSSSTASTKPGKRPYQGWRKDVNNMVTIKLKKDIAKSHGVGIAILRLLQSRIYFLY